MIKDVVDYVASCDSGQTCLRVSFVLLLCVVPIFECGAIVVADSLFGQRGHTDKVEIRMLQ